MVYYHVSGGSSVWNQTGNNIAYTNGKVGIGTSTPEFGLHLKGSGHQDNRLDETTDSTNPVIQFKNIQHKVVIYIGVVQTTHHYHIYFI